MLKGKPKFKTPVQPKTPSIKKTSGPRYQFPYSKNDYILLVGEGNFSFSHSIAKTIGTGKNIVATAYDSESVVEEKYTNDAVNHIKELKDLGGTVLFDIDATKLEKRKILKNKRFTHIIFNFPHCLGIKDQDRNILSNQQLLLNFFNSASKLLTTPASQTVSNKDESLDEPSDFEENGAVPDLNRFGEIHVSLKSGLPYDNWDIRMLSRKAGLRSKVTMPFNLKWFPLYEHRRTLGFKDGLSKGGNQEIAEKNPKLYAFVIKESLDPQHPQNQDNDGSKKRNRDGHSEDSDSDD
ncbi:hypothetical protein H4219_000854 [Mycoemilia scoparia]|uniref:25S rRNA (uridine-N(3))-methyltransferase BMT5-like domain-containing protein n=1 Tax=Mycoemilia scoparia TaxID=417184 RepID=A0A9W8A695_9FUNG|nr:hypothetical protein H4219_000854 [Mycoemilia scoparia]